MYLVKLTLWFGPPPPPVKITQPNGHKSPSSNVGGTATQPGKPLSHIFLSQGEPWIASQEGIQHPHLAGFILFNAHFNWSGEVLTALNDKVLRAHEDGTKWIWSSNGMQSKRKREIAEKTCRPSSIGQNNSHDPTGNQTRVALPHCLNHVRSSKTTREAWQKLKNPYGDKGLTQRLGLLWRLYGVQLEGYQNMEEYGTEIMSLAQQFDGKVVEQSGVH
ncbi:hypothetical protein PR048_024374 [Dryococelus australis]|uniref:Uncharacterized protein n=1 Tax=Dryococelus australis TaxID=614101 RepID=A0ABQ9GNG5_9NEOP|nr:hypothetical protein PR048_024374 [Dryococelus australis]